MIGYYVHHHGLGHLQRAASIARSTRTPVTVLSSLPVPARLAPFASWVQLPRDDVDDAAVDHRAGGALHWAPLSSPGYQRRSAVIAGWLFDHDPDLMIIDVSVEVATLCRLLGRRVVVVAGPGTRNDTAHELVYRLSTAIIAPWPKQLYQPTHLRPHDRKTTYVGAFSRFDGLLPWPRPNTRRVLTMFGTGGTDTATRDIERAAAATPDWTWRVLGGSAASWSEDVWTELQQADVVVTHAGQNALAEVATARRPAVVIAQSRPFGEQQATAAVLGRNSIATTRASWPDPADWPALLADTAAMDGERWSHWNDGGGAARAAATIERVLDHA